MAEVAGPAWAVSSAGLPTSFTEEDIKGCSVSEKVACPSYAVLITNVGVEPSSGRLVITDRLPEGFVLASLAHRDVTGYASNGISCTNTAGISTVTCEVVDPVPPGGFITIALEVAATPALGAALGAVTNVAEVHELGGGGAPPVVTAAPTTVSNIVNGPPAAFGIQDFGIGVLGRDGLPDVQAAGHPVTVSTTINYNTLLNNTKGRGFRTSTGFPAVQEPKTEIVDLPTGFAGNPLATPRCPEASLTKITLHPGQCPAGSQVGEVAVDVGLEAESPAEAPLFNVVPESGYPLEFGFEYAETIFYLRARLLPTAAGYVASVSVPDIARATPSKISGVTVTVFGNPTERDGAGSGQALFTNPDDCAAGPLDASVEMDSWVDPEHWPVTTESAMFEAGEGQGMTGCGALQFEPTLEVKPEESTADTPSGYEVDLRVPQAPNVPGILATPDLRDAVVTLPEGVSIDPSAGSGLAACQETGPGGIQLGSDDLVHDENKVQEGEELGPDGLVHPASGHCPAASQVGTVEVVTPLLEKPLLGHMFVAAPACGGEGQHACTQASATNGELYGLYLEVEGSGVIVKLKGDVSASPVTGQLTTTFRENPELPFSELKLKLEGGELAPLANPQSCGTFTTTSDLTPWSAPVTPDATPFSAFVIGGCGAAMPFAPSFTGESLSAAAAAPTSFSTTFSRNDGEQDFSGAAVSLPAGVTGLLGSVPLCGEPEAALGTCPAASQIGITTVAAGAGPHPFWVSGNVFLTGPYNGAPFGLSVVVDAKAGPFNLGDVVVRAAINVNPITAAVTVTSGAFPQIVDGVPLRVRTVNVLVNRPGFMLNPTNCDVMGVTGTIAAAQGAQVGVSTPFAVAGCRDLAFKPLLSASTQGKASKADGASLDVKVVYPSAGEANIRSVKTDLPLQLPSRLSTLQKACTAAVFEANPALCPAASVVGIAKAVTPVLPVTLMGPAYLVSHGNEKFPNLVIVLEGDGVRVDLTGDTDIKKGITSTTFKSVPDDPVSSFELYLPEGKYSILGTYLPVNDNYDLCGHKLAMPTEILGQNGAVIKQTTMIAITGCPKPKRAVKKAKTASDSGHAGNASTARGGQG
jgi:hypothetical protein